MKEFRVLFYVLHLSSGFLLFADSLGTDGVVPVLEFQKSGVPSTESYAVYPHSLPTLESFTLCYRLYIYFHRKEIVVVSYALDDKDNNVIRLDHTKQGFRMMVMEALNVSREELPLRKWQHYCLAVNFISGSWFMTIQGVITMRQEGDSRIKNKTIPGGGLLILGQDQDLRGGGFQVEQSLSGTLTELQIWDKVLNESSVAAIALVQSDLQGNVLHWQNAVWELHGGVEKLNVRRDSLFVPYTRYVMLAKKRTFKDAAQLCKTLQGKIATPTSDEENLVLFNYSEPYYPVCRNNIGYIYLWVGYTDSRLEGAWEDSSTSLPIQYQGSWSPYEPNGGKEENCATIHHDSAQWNDVTCSRALMCTVCQFDHQVKIQVLGLCKKSGLDAEYFLDGEKNGVPYFAGNQTSRIQWSPQHNSWILESLWDNQTVGVMKAEDEGRATLPMGSHYWSFNEPLCSGFTKTLELTVTACGSGYFTCGDGSCVPLAQRCDRRTNCLDRSDEEQCSILGISKGYRREIPPSHHLNHSSSLPVFIWVDILALTSVNTMHMVFNVDFILKMAWFDRRLSYYNLKDEADLNNLSQEERNQIWTPAVSFKSARGNSHTILDEEARIHVLKVGDQQNPSSDLVHEVEMFSGIESPLVLERKYRVQYGCAFSLHAYPFDTQICVMEFETQFTTSSYVTLKPGQVNFYGRRQLVEYVVGDITMGVMTRNSSFSGLQVQLVFIRQSGYHLVATYLPTSIMIVIAYLTFYFRVEDFNDRIMVSLTSLLVLSSLLTQTSETLPKTSYFKMVDVWLFFCIVTIFIVILIHTASICAERGNKMEFEVVKKNIQHNARMTDFISALQTDGFDSQRIHLKLHTISAENYFKLTPAAILTFGKIVVPLAVGIFNIIYWIIVLVK